MKTPDSEDAKDRRDEVKELLERCRAMEKDLTEIKERLAQVQRSVDRQMERKRSHGTSLRASGARSLQRAPSFDPFGVTGSQTGRRSRELSVRKGEMTGCDIFSQKWLSNRRLGK